MTSTGQSFSDQTTCVSYVRGGGQLQPKPTEPTPQEQCQQALADAGLTAPADANYILCTAGNDHFDLTAGNDVICGFGGDDGVNGVGDNGLDHIEPLEGDISLGGDGNDRVTYLLRRRDVQRG